MQKNHNSPIYFNIHPYCIWYSRPLIKVKVVKKKKKMKHNALPIKKGSPACCPAVISPEIYIQYIRNQPTSTTVSWSDITLWLCSTSLWVMTGYIWKAVLVGCSTLDEKTSLRSEQTSGAKSYKVCEQFWGKRKRRGKKTNKC